VEINAMNDEVYRMLSESGYSDKAIEFLKNQESIGILENADQVTDLTGPCGDSMKISLKINNNRIDDAKMQILGCPGAVASGSALVSIIKGMSIDEARKLDLDALYRELEKLPDKKIHCARLALKTMHKAIDEYRDRKSNIA
jgi:nitrogen fixation NifU-like protein